MKAYVHSYESLAGNDGDGLRYAVFLQGCPLRCAYCHNPDTQCGNGREISENELLEKLLRYTPYFKSGGGVTFSGGEPLLQAEFIESIGALLKKEGVSYIIDTSGAIPLTDTVRGALSGAESVILDLKFPNDEEYLKYTGARIENTLKTLSYLNEIGKKTVIRTVIVPGINDTEEKIKEYLSLLSGVKCISKYELLPFHTMGFFKYEGLGIENPLKNTPPMDRKRLDELQHYLNNNIKLS